MRVALQGRALRGDAEHPGCELLHAALRVSAGLRPACIAEFVKRWRFPADTDVARDEVRLCHRHEELPLIRVPDDHDLLPPLSFAHLDAGEPPDAVLFVHDKIALAQFTQLVPSLS